MQWEMASSPSYCLATATPPTATPSQPDTHSITSGLALTSPLPGIVAAEQSPGHRSRIRGHATGHRSEVDVVNVEAVLLGIGRLGDSRRPEMKRCVLPERREQIPVTGMR